MDERGRIDELRRRVDKDPASIAFAQLAEELRKAGQYDEAVRVCRTGLERHPTYLAAHVTLGRALLALQQFGEARTEIEYVLHLAPDNLLALKCMSELEAHSVEAAPEPAEAGPHVEPIREPAKPNLRIETAPEPVKVEPPVAAAAEAAPHVPEVAAPLVAPQPLGGEGGPNGGPPPEHPAIGPLEDWQARIQADRAQRHR